MFKNAIRKYEIGLRNLEIRQELQKIDAENPLGVCHKNTLLRAIELGEELYDLAVELREIFRKEGNEEFMKIEDSLLSQFENAIWNLKMDLELGCYLP